ncbi:hypothetical protein OG738_32935 [Amycolatopsis sp. NBC_01488]|nr:hypothetical protein [Amycolatopsis sp. NBC_01488]
MPRTRRRRRPGEHVPGGARGRSPRPFGAGRRGTIVKEVRTWSSGT